MLSRHNHPENKCWKVSREPAGGGSAEHGGICCPMAPPRGQQDWDRGQTGLSCSVALPEVPVPPPSPAKRPHTGLHLWEMFTPMVETTEVAAPPAQRPRPPAPPPWTDRATDPTPAPSYLPHGLHLRQVPPAQPHPAPAPVGVVHLLGRHPGLGLAVRRDGDAVFPALGRRGHLGERGESAPQLTSH